MGVGGVPLYKSVISISSCSKEGISPYIPVHQGEGKGTAHQMQHTPLLDTAQGDDEVTVPDEMPVEDDLKVVVYPGRYLGLFHWACYRAYHKMYM